MKKDLKRIMAAVFALLLLFSGNVVASAQTETISEADAQAVLAQRRDIAEAHMRSMCSMLWRCEEDVLYTTYSDTIPEEAKEYHHLVKGRVYQGLPYSYSGGSKVAFLDFATSVDDNGVVNISGLNWQMLSGSGSYARIGNDCSGAVCQSWAQFGTTAPIKSTASMTPANGYIRVGEYTSSDTSNSKTDQVCINNGEQTMYAAYAQTQKADALVYYKSSGHVVMVVDTNVVYNADGTINGDESTITILEQTRGWIRKDTHVYNEELGEDVYWICGVDIEYTFAKLFASGYLPITCKELVDPATVEAPKVTDSLSPSFYNFKNLLSGTITTNNWMMDRFNMTITDTEGNVVQQCDVYTGRTVRYSFKMSRFQSDLAPKRRGSIDPDALKPGNYHCSVTVRLSTEEVFTVRDYDFTVTDTKNDVHKTTLDFSGGTVHTCPACGEKSVQWKALTTAHVGSDNSPEAGHYYLTESMSDNTDCISLRAESKYCLYLNGFDIKSSGQALYVDDQTTLNIMGSGTITGGYTSMTAYCGVAIDNNGGTVNLYGGTYQHYKVGDSGAMPIIGVRSGGTVKLYDGACIQGTSGVSRSSVLIHEGSFYMYGGKVTNGYGTNGANFLVGYSGSGKHLCYLHIYGGEVTGGNATGMGGNIYSVYDSHTYIRGGTISNGKAAKGGNICMNKGANLIMDGGFITGGTAKTIGNNLYLTTNNNTVTGTKLSDCGAVFSGTAKVTGNIVNDNNAFVILRSGAEGFAGGKRIGCFGDVEDALSAYKTGGYDYLKLYQDAHLPAGNWKADLNGNRVFLDGSLEITTDGGAAFVPVALGISKINLRASAAGIYYTGMWDVSGLDVASYGIATSTYDMPGFDFDTDADTLYAANSSNGVLIKNIFSENAADNAARGKTRIHGAAYVTLADGSTIIGGKTASYSLYELITYLEGAENSKWEAQREEFITTWNDAFSAWGMGT